MADADFAVHQYLPSAFMVGTPEETSVGVARTNRHVGCVTLSLADGSFHWFDALTADQAATLGKALLEASADADAAVPVTESMGYLQLMVRRATGGLFDVKAGEPE